MLRLRSSSLRSTLLSSVIRKGRFEATSTILIRSFARRRNNSDYIDTKLESKQVPVQYKPAIQPDEDKPTEFTIDPINRVETLQALDPDDLDEENADLPDSQVDVGRRLLTLSNSHYRRVTHLPNWLENKKKDMTENRTLAQIRRCLKSWMVKTDISEMKSYLNRPLHYNTAKKPTDPKPNRTTKYLYGPEETTAYVYYHMPERYTITTHLLEDLKMYTNKGFTPKKVLDYGCGPATVAASLATVWPEASKEMSYAGVEISRSMIDAANIMIQDIMPNATFWTKTSEIIGRCLEKNERYDLIVCSYTLSEFHNDETRRVATQMLYELLEPNGYLLFIENGNPIGSHIVRTARQYLLHLSSTVDKKGNFELYQEAVEEEEKKKPRKEIDEDDEKDDEEEEKEEDDEDSLSGEDLKGNETLRQRVQKIAKSNKKEEPLKPLMMILPPPKTYVYTDLKAKIIAPCTHDGLCPLKKDQWCSFAQKVFSGTIRKDSEEKYSYVMLQKVVNPSRENNKIKTASELSRAQWLKKEEVDDLKKPLTKQMIETLRPLQILNRFIDITEKRDEKQALRMLDILDQTNWDNYHPNNVRYEYARILRSPMKERGHVVFDLCLPSGEVTRYNHSKATLKYFPHLYRAVRKTSWGGLFPAFMKKQIEKKVQKPEEIRIRSDEDLERFLRSSRQYGDEDDDDDESMFERRGRRSSKRGRRTADDGDDDRAFDQLLQSLDVAKKEPNKFGSNGKGGRNTAPRQNAEYRVMEDREVDRNRDLVSRNSPKEDEEEEEEVREPVRGRRRRSSILKNREN